MRWIFVALLITVLTGCSTVVSTHPFGNAPLDLTEQVEKWTGTWRAPNGPCAITVSDATNGVLSMTSTKPQSWWRWSNETQRVYLRTGGGWTFASMEDTEGTNTFYTWGKVANEDGTILWWMPNPDKFKPLVESGALPGTVKNTAKKKKPLALPILGYAESGEPIYQTTDDMESQPENVEPKDVMVTGDTPVQAVDDSNYFVTLLDLEPKHYEIISASSNGVMFDWEHPLVLVKESARVDLRYLRAATKRWMREQGK